MTPIRVCLLNDHLGWGGTALHGVSRYFLSVIPAFDRSQVDPLLAILRPRDALAKPFEDERIPVHFLGGPGTGPGGAAALLKLLREKRIQVVHAQGYAGTTLARALKPLTRTRIVLHSHEADDRYPRWLSWPDRGLAPFTDHAFANGLDSLEFFVRQRAVPRARTQLLHNGIDLRRVKPAPEADVTALRRELSLDPSAEIVVTLTRFSPEKGNRVLLDALPELIRLRPHAVVLFAGHGPELEACQAHAEALGVGDSVRFLGFRSDTAALLGAAQAFVIPSLREGTSYATLEALAFGVPIVASAVGGLLEVLEDGRTARLVAAGDAGALARGLCELLADRELADGFAHAGRQRVLDFDVERHVAHLTAVYRALVSGDPVPEPPA